jgi:CHAT domain-containing protein
MILKKSMEINGMKVLKNYLVFFIFIFAAGIGLAQPVADDIDAENLKLPPRDIKDVLRVIQETKPDFALQEKAKKVLALPVPSSSDSEVLNQYYYRKAVAEETLGNNTGAVSNLKKVVNEYPSNQAGLAIEELFTYALRESDAGNYVTSNQALERARAKVPPNLRGWYLTLDKNIAIQCSIMGDFSCANERLKSVENNIAQIKSVAKNVSATRYANWDLSLEHVRGFIFLSEGKFIESERSFRRALKLNQDILNELKDVGGHPLDNEARVIQDDSNSARPFITYRILLLGLSARSYLGQRRLVEAESQAREALLMALKNFGPSSASAGRTLALLASIVSEQGRQPEAVLLANAALKSYQDAGLISSSNRIADARRAIGTALVADGKYQEADKVFSQMKSGVKDNAEYAASHNFNDLDWVLGLLKIGKGNEALVMTQNLLTQESGRLDKTSPRLATVRSFHASALQASNKTSEASAEFKQAIPILMDQAQNNAENDSISVRSLQRSTFLFESYIANLASETKSNPAQLGSAAAEAFKVADIARGSGVQRALTASAARASIKDPQLANLARQEQDLQRRINTLSTLLTGLLSTPANQQLPGVQTKLKSDIESFKSQRDTIKKEIERKFPDYAELVDPKPATVERTQRLLKPDEVLVSWYFADNVGYVWAITKDAPVQFVQLPIGKAQIAKEVTQLRKSLDPGVASIEEIPAFDVALANQLYQQILAPVESSLKGKKVMLVVPHAELGQLPLAVLVTKATAQPAKSGMPFAGYKSVPFLAKDIAVAQIPSVTALTALRSLPEGDANRKNFIGFGDPYFSAQQEKQADKQKGTQLATRGIPLALRSAPKTSGVSSAELALLPRLPDTSLEIEEIAKVVGAGPDDIYLHKQASVKQVMSMDLSNRKVVMFSTHGLVPGELNGLTQPALALSSPDVTGDKDDGLLTMDKVISLKLNADWVVLSACNTAGGEGAGSEAVSGLGRAFFFAGTKALLVSNWPVDSVASRQLMTDLFKRQQENKGLQKSEALRQAMLAQIDQGGAKDGNTMKYSYAHPLFWAPFVVVGD